MRYPESLLTPGSTFEEHYQILSKLGEGGFGIVYHARQLSTGQPVAIKLMRLSESDDARRAKRVARFQREMSLCSQLQHPNIVQLINAGQTKDGALYSVFSFVPGRNLKELLTSQGPLPLKETMHLMMQVLDALACAHAEGVVHRDLKPSNLMILETGGRRNAIILDFGIGALLAADPEKRQETLTDTNEILGTPGYAAPEQLRGGEPSACSDLFSWGVIFLECLAGQSVFRGSTTAEILYSQLSSEPVALPALLEGHPLGEALWLATQKDPASRTSSAVALLRALEEIELGSLLQRDSAFLSSAKPGGALPRFSTPSATARTPQPSPLIEGERRQVTALCCTLQPLFAPKDAEEDDESSRAQLSQCADVIRRHKGHIVAVLGDQLLAYFGYPRAEEDDARRAARAALALQAMQRERFALKITLHTGPVVVGEWGKIADAAVLTGATPMIVTRLAREVPPSVVFATSAAQRLLRGRFLLEAEGRRSLDDAPISLYRVSQEYTAKEQGPTPESRGASLVGRDKEMELLLERWGRASRGAGQSILVTGEPGIGKSRLGRELRGRLSGQLHGFIEARCAPDAQNSALFPIVELLSRLLGVEREASTEKKIERLEGELSRYGLKRDEAMPLFLSLFSLPVTAPYAPLSVPAQRQKELTLQGILSLLFSMAEEQPLILLAEDLHWSDATTLELLGLLIKEVPSAPMCILLTARPEFSPPFPTLGMLQLYLNRLERPEIESMARSLVGKSLPSAALEQVASRTDGVPLFVEEMLRMLVESGVLVEREDRFELSGPISEAGIPGTLRDLLTARLDRLGKVKETAQWAAALGREFTIEHLSAVSPLGASAQEDVNALIDVGLVYRKRSQGGGLHIFKHALIRDSAYESLPKSARQRVHALIAKTLEEKFPAVAEARPELLAYHYAAAEEKKVAIGYAQKAAMSALIRSNNAEAISHGRAALEWLGSLEDEKAKAETELTLNGILTPALMATQGFASPQLVEVVNRSQRLISGEDEALAAHPQTFANLWALHAYYSVRCRRDDAISLANLGLLRAQKTGNVGHEVGTLALLGQDLFAFGASLGAPSSKTALEKSCDYLRRSLELYDLENHKGLGIHYGLDFRVISDSTLGLVLCLMGYPEKALEHANRAVEWAKKLEHANSIGGALNYLAGVYHYQREFSKLSNVTSEMLKLANHSGLSSISAYAILLGSCVDNSIEPANSIINGMGSIGALLGIPYYNSIVSESEYMTGLVNDAISRVEKCIEMAQNTNQLYYISEYYRLNGIFNKNINSEKSKYFLEKAIATAEEQGAKLLEIRSLCSLYEILKENKDKDKIKKQIELTYLWFREGFQTPDLILAKKILSS